MSYHKTLGALLQDFGSNHFGSIKHPKVIGAIPIKP
jgi:hypothetical protein